MVRLLPCSGWWPTKIASLSAPIIPVVVFSVRFGHPEWSDCLWKSSRNGGTCQKDHKKRDTGLQLFSSEKKNVLTWWFVWIFIPAQQPVSVLLMWLLMMVRVHVRNMDDVASRMIMSVGSAVRLERREKPNWRRTAAVSSAAGWSSDSVWKARTFLNGTPWKELVTRRRQPEFFSAVSTSLSLPNLHVWATHLLLMCWSGHLESGRAEQQQQTLCRQRAATHRVTC